MVLLVSCVLVRTEFDDRGGSITKRLSCIVARVNFKPESSLSHESSSNQVNFFFFSVFCCFFGLLVNCCVKMMYQRKADTQATAKEKKRRQAVQLVRTRREEALQEDLEGITHEAGGF